MNATIVYASMTGNNEDISEILEEALQDKGFIVERSDVSFADASAYLNSELCVIVTYTYGEGVMTDELQDFYDQLVELNLSGKKFAVLGSGDQAYKNHFCENVVDFEKAFKKCGAVEIASPVKIENSVEDADIELIDQAADQIFKAFDV